MAYRHPAPQELRIAPPGDPLWSLSPDLVRECTALSAEVAWSRLVARGVVDASWLYAPNVRLFLHGATPPGPGGFRFVRDQTAPPIGQQMLSAPPHSAAMAIGSIAAAALVGGAAVAMARNTRASSAKDSTVRSYAAAAGRGAMQGLRGAISLLVPATAGDAGAVPWSTRHALRLAGMMPTLRDAESIASRLMSGLAQRGHVRPGWRILWQVAEVDFDAELEGEDILRRSGSVRNRLAWISERASLDAPQGPVALSMEIVRLGVIPMCVHSTHIVLAVQSASSPNRSP